MYANSKHTYTGEETENCKAGILAISYETVVTLLGYSPMICYTKNLNSSTITTNTRSEMRCK